MLVLVFVIVGIVTGNLFYVVKQQHAVIIERLGKFHRIVGAGFHAKIPFVDRKAATVSLRTMKNGFNIDVKTQDNVTIGPRGLRAVPRELRDGRAPAGLRRLQELLHAAAARGADARLHHRRAALVDPGLYARRGLRQEG